MKKLSKILAVVLCLTFVMAMLPMAVSAAEEKYVEFTVDSLGLAEQNYADGTNTVDGVAVEWGHVGNYGNGIQMRDKEGKGTSTIWNTSALGAGITKIELTYSATQDVKYANADAVIFNFGNEAKGATNSTKLSTEAGVKTYTIVPDAATYTYFYMEHDLGYTMYWDSIKVYYTEGGSSAPVDPPVVEPDDPEEPETKPVIIESGEYVIYAPAFNKALSSTYNGFYNNGVDVTLADGKLTGYTDAEIWTITCDENGIITISNGDNKLAMGAEYSSMPLNEVNDTWILEEAGDGLYYIKNAVRGNYVEWYDSKGNWSSYGTIGEGKEDLFKMALYSLVEEPVDPPVNPPVEDPEDPIPGTGDLGLGAVVVALMAATAGAVIIGKKKEF